MDLGNEEKKKKIQNKNVHFFRMIWNSTLKMGGKRIKPIITKRNKNPNGYTHAN